MPNFKVNVDFPRIIAQGDSAEITLTVDADLTGYDIRAEIFDDESNSVQLANTASGGSDSQISLSVASSISTIVIYVPKDNTEEFNKQSYIEVEIEDTNDKVYTIWRSEFKMTEEKIEWTSPS